MKRIWEWWKRRFRATFRIPPWDFPHEASRTGMTPDA